MKSNQREGAASIQIINRACLRIGRYQRISTHITIILLFSVMVIMLLQAGAAFGAGERFLGVQVTDYEQGVIIQQVVPDSPATRVVDTSSGQNMSLEPGDVIQMVNGVNVSTPLHFVQLIRTGPPVALIRVWDVRNRLFRDVAAGVGPSNEVAAYLNQRTPKLEDNGRTYMPPSSQRQLQGASGEERRARIQVLETQIGILERKIKDQERRVRQYEEWGDENPGATNVMLQQSARNLLQTYERQKVDLEMQKTRLESGM